MKQETYVELILREFQRLKTLADGAISQCSDEQFFAIPAPGDNRVAVIAKHVAGNLVSRWTDLLTSDGEKPDRNRDAEFEILPEDMRSLDQLRYEWPQGFARFSVEAMNPGIPDLTDEQMSAFESVLGCRVRRVLQHL